jgi:hypothetical protein
MSAYLRGHQAGARYELATLAASGAAALVARDARPVLVLTANGRPVVPLAMLARLAAVGQVRDVLVTRGCHAVACVRTAHWVRTHGTPVPAATAGRPGMYALDARVRA